MFRKKALNLRRRPDGRSGNDTSAKRPSVFSYRASRSSVGDNVGRGQTKEKIQRPGPGPKARLKKLLKLVGCILIAAFIGRNLLLTSSPDIVLIDPANTFRNATAYQEAATKAFAASAFNKNKITVNTNGIRESLKQTFPELADVSVSLPIIGQKPVVYLQPSTSRLILQTSSGAFVVDDAGKAVASGAFVDSLRQAGLPEAHDESQLTVQVGDSVLPSTTISFITEVVYQLKAKGLAIDTLTLPNVPSELHVRVKDVGYYVKFNTRGDARVEVGSFLALKDYLSAQKKTPAEYVDARVDNRVYYK